jgi:hypothetical protein
MPEKSRLIRFIEAGFWSIDLDSSATNTGAPSHIPPAEIAGVSEADWRSWESDPTLESYEVIFGEAWELFLRKTEGQRPEISGFTFRRKVPPNPSW